MPTDERLRHLAVRLAAAATAVALCYWAAALALRSASLALVAGLLTAAAALFGAAARSRRHSAPLLVAGILGLPFGCTPLVPQAWPADAMAALLAAVVAFRFSSGLALRRMLTACCVALAYCIAAGEFLPPLPLAPWFERVAVVGGALVAGLFVLWVVGQLSAELHQSLEEAHASRRRPAFLAAVGDALVRATEPEAVLSELARLAVPELADWCTTALGGVGQSAERVAAVHRDPAKSEFAARYQRSFPAAAHRTSELLDALAAGRPLWRLRVRDEDLQATAQGPEHLQLMRELGISSLGLLPLVARGRVLGVLSLMRSDPGRPFNEDDVTLAEALARHAALALDNARLLEETRRRFEDARQAIGLRDDVLAVVSHDLNNLLQPTLAAGGLLVRRLPDEGRGSPGHYARLIERSASKMARLIRDLLDAASLDTGGLSLQIAEQDAVSIAREAADVMLPAAEAKGLRLESRLPGEPLRLACDRGRLVQVLGNLLSNAIKFTEAGSVTLVLSRQDDRCLFEVLDTGPGIERTELENVFDRYWRGRPAQVPGSGLGLFIAKGIIGAHGGRIWAESEPGRGSAFRLTLPLAPRG